MATYFSLLKKYGISYLGGVKTSAKVKYSYDKGVMTYIIYLAPADLSGRNVCPKSKYCKAFCLNGAGHNKAEVIAKGINHSKINLSRIKKTNIFFDNREDFMLMMIHEIMKYEEKAKSLGMQFACRLNGTSDISLNAFTYQGTPIYEIFPNVQFYDYTKVYNRIETLAYVSNYDITFSYDGHNWDECEQYLSNHGRIAVVFDTPIMPKYWRGYRVIDGNKSDDRFNDDRGVIVGLHYHKPGNIYLDEKHGIFHDTQFVVKQTDSYIVF